MSLLQHLSIQIQFQILVSLVLKISQKLAFSLECLKLLINSLFLVLHFKFLQKKNGLKFEFLCQLIQFDCKDSYVVKFLKIVQLFVLTQLVSLLNRIFQHPFSTSNQNSLEPHLIMISFAPKLPKVVVQDSLFLQPFNHFCYHLPFMILLETFNIYNIWPLQLHRH